MGATHDRRRHSVRSTLVVIAAALMLASPSTAAAPPSNDAFGSASLIGAVPFSDSANLEDASVEPGEQHFCNFKTRSIWYRIDGSIRQPVTITVSGAVGTLLRDFGGGSVGNLGFDGCLFGSTTVLLQPFGTYYVQVSDSGFGSTPIQVDVAAVDPPPNDAFADSKVVSAVPYSDVVPMLAATVESDEPPATASFLGTAWWGYQAAASGPLLVQVSNCCGEARVYTGDSLASLEEVPGTSSFGRRIFQAEAGTTYRFQVGHTGNVCCAGLLGLSISEAPGISTAVMYHPFDPSSFDTLGFSAHVFDPAAFPTESVHWGFGDGGTAEGHGVTHRYLADGDYVVTMTARTSDGRTGTSTTTVSVRTHDVGITKFVVPQSAQEGKTKTITVEVKSARYDENVSVQLLRSVPGGFEPVGSSVQLVRAQRHGTAFTFSYTFRPEDKSVGKVTFKAVATISGARDALSADNEVVALPTKVS
jgi:hypothetical protein